MTPMTPADVCEAFGWNATTLRYHRQRDFPVPRWTVGGARKTPCWTKADVMAWHRDRGKRTNYADALITLDRLGSSKAAAAVAGVPASTFRDFMRDAGIEPPATSAIRVLRLAAKIAGEHGDESKAKTFRAAIDALLKL